ncbi:MAG: putative Subtilisin [Marmoricola sp.]|nr:putative Subtilisin [Marmoricola sp.]
MSYFSRSAVAIGASVAVVAALAGTGATAIAAPVGPSGTQGVSITRHDLMQAAQGHTILPRSMQPKSVPTEPGQDGLPAGVPTKGRYAFLLKLSIRDTSSAYAGALSQGKAAAHDAAVNQRHNVITAQNKVISDLPARSSVLYRTHAVLSGLAVMTDVRNYASLRGLPGVTAVYPIAPKTPSNSYAVPLQGAPAGWEAHGDLGANSTVAIIDTGVDYTHADFGGVGTVADYQAAKAQLGEPVSANEFPGPKVIGGYDFAGDAYNSDPTSPDYNPVTSPDPWPLDCNSHGTHVAGTVAGYGENADGSTYTGDYNTSTPFDTMRIGPGMAPEAKLYAYRVFGCAGSTDLVSAAIDRAADPNGDGDTSDHVDVINMSLGSDYGSPQDGDSVSTNDASSLGITVVVASGNAGDIYDVGGSPGDATSALTAAASRDAYAQVDALNVTAPAGIAGAYAAERSIAYDWATKPDLSGDVAQVTQSTNLDACNPLNTADANAVNGKIAFVEWTDVDSNRRCGSAARAANLAAAGAIGFIYADDEEHFSAGITGSATIPGVLVAKSGGDAIRTQLAADNTVTIGSTTLNGFRQVDTALNDQLASFSSRGIGDAGDVKPDIAAVGDTVFSASNGSGNLGQNDSGTSMATPMTAGLAALVKSLHPNWNAEQTKADIMNTAGQDVFTGSSHTGDIYAPQRVGAGRIKADAALDNQVLAYVAGGTGAVSASFGPQPVSAPTVLTKTIKVENTGLTSQSYDVSYVARTEVPGATYSVSPSSVTVDPRSSTTVTLTLTLDPSAMTKTVDPTIATFQDGVPRQFQADASGLLELNAQTDTPDLRVPVYAAPRPASTMTQAGSLTLPDGAVQTALLPLTGQAYNQGSVVDGTKTQSTVAGFELQALSGLAPTCSVSVTSGCVGFPDERAADLKAVGVTSSAPELTANSQDPMAGEAYFAVNTQGPWRTAASSQEFDIYIDGNGDGIADAVLFNTRLTSSDVLVSELIDLNTGHVLDVEPLNDSFGDTDTAMFNSDTLVLPTAIGAIPGVSPGQSRISYIVQSFSPYQGDPVDKIGDVDPDGNLVNPLSFDVLNPGIALYGSYTGDASPLLYPDAPSAVVNLRRDAAAYATDGALGAMIVHFGNQLGDKTQVVGLQIAPAVNLTLSPNPVGRGQQVTANVTVPGTGTPATGAVVIKQGSTTLATGTVVAGAAQLHFTEAVAGAYPVTAEYAGDGGHQGGTSAPVLLHVAKSASSVGITVSPNPVRRGRTVTVTVRVTTVAGIPATGVVTVRRGSGTVLGQARLVNGVATIHFVNHSSTRYGVKATYPGDRNYNPGTSATVQLRITR